MVNERVDPKHFAEIQATVRNADLTAEIAAALASSRHKTAHQAHAFAGVGLTQRERDVLQMMATGKSNREIAGAIASPRDGPRWRSSGREAACAAIPFDSRSGRPGRPVRNPS